MKKLLFFLLLLIPITNLLAQNSFVNSKYELKQGTVKIAIIPLIQKNGDIDKTIIYNISKILPSHVEAISTDLEIHNILCDTLTNSLVNRITQKEYSKEEFRNYPNLSSIFGLQKIPYLKSSLGNADLLLVTVKMSSRRVTKLSGKGNTTIYGLFRLYDLNSGDLIFNL